MKNYSLLSLAVVSLFFIVFFASCDKEDNVQLPTIIEFEDPILHAQVKEELGLSDEDEINSDNILLLDTLRIDTETSLSFAAISSLAGLETAVNLVYLHFGGTSVTDLNPIGNLKKIEYLRFNNTGITDISAISGYTTLTYFNANTVTGLTDISPLSGNTGLKEAILREVPFGNEGMSTIAGFSELYRLNMRATGVTDISVLAVLMEGGTLQNSTPGAGGRAVLDIRGNAVDCSVIAPYIANIADLNGC